MNDPGDPWVVVQIANSQLFVMAAEPRCCTRCAALLAEDAKFCGMCGNEADLVRAPRSTRSRSRRPCGKFRESFHYLVLDAPPVLAGGDVNLIQDSADAIVFATRKGKSAARNLRRAIEQVAPAPVAGVVLIEK